MANIFRGLLTAFHNRLNAGHYPSYFHKLTAGVIRRCERLLGQPTARLTPADHVGELAPAPVLILTGAEDRHATAEEAVRLYERREGPAQLLLVPSAGHEDVCEVGASLYRQTVLGFLERSLFDARDVAA